MLSDNNKIDLLAECKLCPRECKVNRHNSKGFCGQSDEIKIARADLHMWEEPCISGTRGSGTIFFSGCTLRCIFCQNHEISQQGKGYFITQKELADSMLCLQEKGAHNINLVSPTPYIPMIIEALDSLKGKLNIPIVYNCGGYERVETLKTLEGYIDIYLPDFKYVDSKYSLEYSGAENYAQTALNAIKEMFRQVGKPKYNSDGIMQRGVIIRHLTLPTLRHDSMAVIRLIHENFANDEIVLSLMSQYLPMYKAIGHPKLGRRISTFEYNSVADLVTEFGFDGYMQERSSSSKVYIPDFSDKKAVRED